jgi:hypothetical protein
MEPILRALEAAHRATLREYPRQALQLVEELGQSTLGGDTLDSMRTKGLSAFELWVLDTAKARIPVALNTGEMQEVSIILGHCDVSDVGLGTAGGLVKPFRQWRRICFLSNAPASGVLGRRWRDHQQAARGSPPFVQVAQQRVCGSVGSSSPGSCDGVGPSIQTLSDLAHVF